MPLTLAKDESIKHTYTIEITRAMFSQECFEVFQKYEKHVHGKDKDSKSGYENFLCQSPLYDPRLSEEHNLPHFDKKNIDDHRERKDEGVFPQALGSYHYWNSLNRNK